MLTPQKDQQTVTASGEIVQDLISGVEVRPAVNIVDERGSLTEIFNFDWGVCTEPIVQVYQSIIRPGRVKGWGVHKVQTDRYFVSVGAMKVVLFDAREDSPTYGKINEIYLTEENRSLLVIPPGVYHADKNVGNKEVVLIILPTVAYNYENPDKFRLPIQNDLIPYSFDEIKGGA